MADKKELRDIRDDPDLAIFMQKWIDSGVMKFRWPNDNSGVPNLIASWFGLSLSELDDSHTSTRAGAAREAIKRMKETNEGPAFEAFLRYWSSVPLHDTEVMAKSFQNIKDEMDVLDRAIADYQAMAANALYALKEAVESFHMPSWVPIFGSDFDPSSLVTEFDANMAEARQWLVDRAKDAQNTIATEGEVFEQIARPIPRDLILDW